ncbi:hypothetical protein [Luteibacter sp. OK325]|uniref:hypothetical protein n=1 Tax=Luteibacter sp. OK325 TaxID=2135670 RepID=UPI0011B23526|nr:hypothetical protein [Luteibacter sp. OK325]
MKRILRFMLWALLSGVIVASSLKIYYLFDPKMIAVKQAIVGDKGVLDAFGIVNDEDIKVFHILETVDASRAFTRVEYTASLTGSKKGGRVKVLLKKSSTDGAQLGNPTVFELRLRD